MCSPTGVRLMSLSAWLHICSMQRSPRLSVPVAQLATTNPTPVPCHVYGHGHEWRTQHQELQQYSPCCVGSIAPMQVTKCTEQWCACWQYPAMRIIYVAAGTKVAIGVRYCGHSYTHIIFACLAS